MSQDTHPPDGAQERSGAAKSTGYGAGGLGSGAARAHDTPEYDKAFDVTPDGRRAGTSSPGEIPEVATGEPPPGDLLDQPAVATGRRPDGHYEPDETQVLKARFTHKPAPGSIASEALGTARQNENAEAGAVSDAAVADDDSSVWDARPPGR